MLSKQDEPERTKNKNKTEPSVHRSKRRQQNNTHSLHVLEEAEHENDGHNGVEDSKSDGDIFLNVITVIFTLSCTVGGGNSHKRHEGVKHELGHPKEDGFESMEERGVPELVLVGAHEEDNSQGNETEGSKGGGPLPETSLPNITGSNSVFEVVVHRRNTKESSEKGGDSKGRKGIEKEEKVSVWTYKSRLTIENTNEKATYPWIRK